MTKIPFASLADEEARIGALAARILKMAEFKPDSLAGDAKQNKVRDIATRLVHVIPVDAPNEKLFVELLRDTNWYPEDYVRTHLGTSIKSFSAAERLEFSETGRPPRGKGRRAKK